MNSQGHIAHLDGWRGLAIFAVFFGHFVSKAQYWWIGTFGVALFFVLSGFLMCNILFFKNTKLPDFFARRIIRVGPTFVLFVLAITVYASTMQPVRYTPSATEVLSTLLFLRSYLPSNSGIINDDWPIGHLWSLNVEEHTYIYLAIAALCARKLNRRWMTAAILLVATASALYFSVYYVLHPASGNGTPAYFRSEAASLGILAAVSLSYIKRSWLHRVFDRIHPLLPVVSLAVAFVCFTDPLRWRGFHLIIAPLCLAFTINFLDRLPAAFIRLLSNERLCWIGRISFSLYIWQQPFHFAVCHYDMNAWLAVLLAVGLGLVSFYGFENPVRLWLTQAWDVRKSNTSQVGQAIIILK